MKTDLNLPDKEEHDHQSDPGCVRNLWCCCQEPCCEDEPLESNHQKLGECDEIPRARILLDHQLQEDDVGHAAQEHQQYGKLGFDIHDDKLLI